MMKTEAKIIWILGSIWISGYFIISYILYSSWVSIGYLIEWWVIGVPLLIFVLVTVLMFVFSYYSYSGCNWIQQMKKKPV